jgi:3-dehydroquinate synthase
MMETVPVALGPRSYPIYIGTGLLAQGAILSRHIVGSPVMVVTNETVAPLYLAALMETLQDWDPRSVVLPDGEQFKTLDELNRLYDALLQSRCGRDSTIVALGGGVVGDMAGFAAATYQRGIAYIQAPTTLLAQVDSSVGGKTAVNHALGKNMIGAFHQPSCVVTDIDTLATLPARELRGGIAEVIKYGLIHDAAFFVWLEENIDTLLARTPQALAYAIRRCCENKAAIVTRDEREADLRAVLNFGHTFGHAIETGLGYHYWLHGEAVAVGMHLAARLSANMDWIDWSVVDRLVTLLRRAGLPTTPPPALAPARIRELMVVDKKARGGRLRLVLLQALGRAVVTDEFDHVALAAVLGDAGDDSQPGS